MHQASIKKVYTDKKAGGLRIIDVEVLNNGAYCSLIFKMQGIHYYGLNGH